MAAGAFNNDMYPRLMILLLQVRRVNAQGNTHTHIHIHNVTFIYPDIRNITYIMPVHIVHELTGGTRQGKPAA